MVEKYSCWIFQPGRVQFQGVTKIRLGLRDAKGNIEIKNELIKEGGRHKVSCLRIEAGTQEARWLYSSNKICAFLDDSLNKLKAVS